MKRIILAGAAVSGLAMPALAADLYPYPRTPAYVAAYNWTGFYAGANLGGAWGRITNTDTFTGAAGITAADSSSATISGLIGGGQIGYNWQTGNLLFGLEADIDGSGERGTNSAVISNFGTNAVSDSVRAFGTARGRVGFAADRWLWYVTGGFAWQSVAFNDGFTPLNSTLTGISNGSSTRAGYSVGGGLETALWGNWTGRVEYLYLDTGTWTTTAAGLTGLPLGTTTVTNSVHTQNNVVRTGVNFRF
jgi:outer membrane immunogenic protein